MAAAQFAQMLLQRLHRKALQRRAQGGLHAGRVRARRQLLRQKPARQMWRNAFAGLKIPPLQRRRGKHVQAVAVDFHARLHQFEHPARALRHLGGFGVGRPHQRAGHGGFALVQPVRRLAEQRAAQRVNTDQFAAKRHQIQVRLQNLVFAPALLQHLRGKGLADFLRDAAAVVAGTQIVVQQPGQLHAQRGRTPRPGVPKVGPRRAGHRPPVDAAVFVKPLVFAQHQRRAQGRRNVGQGNPLPAPHAGI